MIHNRQIRFANQSDCRKMLNIYSPYILESAISFESEVPSLEEFTGRFDEIANKYPWLVFEQGDQILGFVYGSTHRSRSAYGWSCEVTVYVDKNHHKKGIGSVLYASLFPILKEQGFYNLFAGITQPNEGSNKVHSRLGFQKIGTYKNIGHKFNQWHDVSWYQLEINSGGKPSEPRSVGSLFKENVVISTIDPSAQPAGHLMAELDSYISQLYPPEENFLDSPTELSRGDNKMIGAFVGDLLVGIGAIKFYDDYGEIKRMWVPHLYRGFGLSKKILSHLEEEALNRGLKTSRLETGNLQKEAISLYSKFGYKDTLPFGSYEANNSSCFMEKKL